MEVIGIIIRAEVPESLIHENIHRIMEMKPTNVPEPLDPRKEILKVKPGGGHLDPEYRKFKERLKVKGTYYAWFYVWTGGYTWYWALNPDNDCAETGCTQAKPSCSIYADIHQEHLAWDDANDRYVSIMFNAECSSTPTCPPSNGVFHLRSDYDDFPTSTDWYYCGVDFYSGFNDCVGQRYDVEGQAAVVYWPY
jgi:hypothetical protein